MQLFEEEPQVDFHDDEHVRSTQKRPRKAPQQLAEIKEEHMLEDDGVHVDFHDDEHVRSTQKRPRKAPKLIQIEEE